MDGTSSIPSPTSDTRLLPAPLADNDGLRRYLNRINRFPFLEAEEERSLARQWRASGDKDAAHQLVSSHLRLVARMAGGYRGYGLPLQDLIAEGNLGLMRAVQRYDPDKSVNGQQARLATYAMWWIRANIQEFILRSWSMVRVSASAAQKRLFFGLRRAKQNIQAYESGDLSPDHARALADTLKVSEAEVMNMNRRLSGADSSLNAPVGGDDNEGDEWQDWLEDPHTGVEAQLAETQERTMRQQILRAALDTLDKRERTIILARRLSETPPTLEVLGKTLGISRERVRQIESRAAAKLERQARAMLESRQADATKKRAALR